ncbi:MAG: phosphoribosylformylglycinamidine cyclo-ligase [Acidimicrobiales bacterium]
MSRLLEQPQGGMTYQSAGVSIEAGEQVVQRIKRAVDSTKRPEVLGSIGGFAGMFALNRAKMKDPVLVASADGVGTKLEVARQMGRYDTVGRDLVAMLVDDLACVGAEPLFMLDYVAVGSLDPARLEELVTGIAEGCRNAGIALLGGETAEHGDVMHSDDLDVAGFVLGVLERGHELGVHRVHKGDALIGFGSPGLRSNGYSLARKVLMGESGALARPAFPGATRSLGDELLLPSVIYAPALTAMRKKMGDGVRAAAHITGGGIMGNVVRIVPPTRDAVIHLDAFETPEIFFEIQRRGQVSADEMVRVFNCGLGMVVVVDADDTDTAVEVAREEGLTASVIGNIRSGSGSVVLT